MAYNDGSVPFGSQIVTIGSLGHIAEQISYNEPSTPVERFNQVGDPSGQVLIAGFGTGSATLQALSTSTTPVTIGCTFNLVRNNSSTVGVVISEVGEAQSQFDAHKITVGFRRRIN